MRTSVAFRWMFVLNTSIDMPADITNIKSKAVPKTKARMVTVTAHPIARHRLCDLAVNHYDPLLGLENNCQCFLS